MKKLSLKQLEIAHTLISGFHLENRNIVFDVPSIFQYCMENDLRNRLKENKFSEVQIDQIIEKSQFQVFPRKKGINKVIFKFDFKDFKSFLKN